MRYQLVILSLVVLAGCARDGVEWICPNIGVGGLVVSEIRGDNGNDDPLGQWIELYNASGSDIDLRGTRVVVTKLDGSGVANILIRRSFVLPAAGYAVIGNVGAGFEPAHIDYGYTADFTSDIYDSGAIDVYACDVFSDRVIYRNLPASGSFAVTGAVDPAADVNDDDTMWCVDNQSGVEYPEGTPGARNVTCGA